MQVHALTFNPFEENTYLLSDDTREAVLVDPGCYEPAEQKALTEKVRALGLQIKYILNTHGHIDHVLGNQFAQFTYQVPLLIPTHDRGTYGAVKTYAPNYGFPLYQEAVPDGFLEEHQEIQFGNTLLKVLFLPGHSAGHIGFYHEASKTLVSGDVLFYHSIGRTDLPGGNHAQLIDNIHRKLFTLSDDVVVYPGHGEPTTIGEEKVNNPFCAVAV